MCKEVFQEAKDELFVTCVSSSHSARETTDSINIAVQPSSLHVVMWCNVSSMSLQQGHREVWCPCLCNILFVPEK